MKLLLYFILFLPIVYASSLAVYPLKINLEESNIITIFNPNDKEINFNIKSKLLKVDKSKGNIKPHGKVSVRILNKEKDLLIIESYSDNNNFGINPGIAVKVNYENLNKITSKSAWKWPEIDYTFMFGIVIVLFLMWIVFKI